MLNLPVPTSRALAEAQLRAINHRFVHAFSVSDMAFIEALATPDFLLMGVTGDWIDRTRMVESMRAPSIGSVSYDDVRVRLFGPNAVLHGVFEAGADIGSVVCVRYTHVYRWSGTDWRLANAQNTALKPGVARQQHQCRAPMLASWLGADSIGTDEDVLVELNARYVRAFREADASWYDAHLSHDYVVISSDGSFHDRAKALNDFAKPVYAEVMRSFPVGRVRIRQHGDMALIDAENAYERKDGLKGINRYTDIWHRQEEDLRWLCIAAHITTHKAPG